jgi:integrase/recombinase XerD
MPCAVKRFFDWCDERRLEPHEIEAITLAAYVEETRHTGRLNRLVKQPLAAIRQLFDHLTTGGILEVNPGASVRGPRYVVKRGKTPVLSVEEARKVLDSIESNTLIGLRTGPGVDRHHGLQLHTGRSERNYEGRRPSSIANRDGLGFTRRGASAHQMACHPQVKCTCGPGLRRPELPTIRMGSCFPSVRKASGLAKRPSRFDVFHMVKRRAKAAALPYSTCCHTFRATGITAYLENGGTLEHAQTIANHESPRTTNLYDRTREELSFDEVARIKF